jgi:hypothetical protein
VHDLSLAKRETRQINLEASYKTPMPKALSIFARIIS